MKALVWKAREQMAVEEVPLPSLKPHEVLVRVANCGVCGSDLRVYRHTTHFRPGAILGHEISGAIAATGADVQGWRAGDRVAIQPRLPCGECGECRAGRVYECPNSFEIGVGPTGGFAEFVRAHPAHLIAVPDHVPDDLAALAEPFSIGLHAIRRSRFRAGDVVAVNGGGPIGLMLLQALLLSGARQVYVLDPSPVAAAAAVALGASAVFDPSDAASIPTLQERTNGGPEIVFECAGVPGALQPCCQMVRKRGQVVLIGVCLVPDTVRTVSWLAREISITTSLDAQEEHWFAMELIARHGLKTEVLLTHRISLAELADVFDRGVKPEAWVKGMVTLS